MKTIVAAIDLNAPIENILDAAIDMARMSGAELILVTVEVELPGMEGATDSIIKKEFEQSYGEDIHELQVLARRITSEGIACRALILQGAVVNQLTQVAHEMKADLLIVGNNCHGLLAHSVAGGAAVGVIRCASQKVLLVPIKS